MNEISKKKVLDILYRMRAEFAREANDMNTRSYQLPEADVSGRNIAAGRSQAYSNAANDVDAAIEQVIASE